MTYEVIYHSSEYILDWFSDPNHRVSWCPHELVDMGDFLTPVPVMQVFFEYLGMRGELFTQKEFSDYFWSLVPDFKDGLERTRLRGLGARIWHNFYPSAIDSLHVWALLVESGRFARCLINSTEDVVGKTDLIVYTKNGQRLDLALRVDSPRSNYRAGQKRANASGMRGVNEGTIDILLPYSGRERGAGNKRWYAREDLEPVFRAADVEYVPKHTKISLERYIPKQGKRGQAQLLDYIPGASA